MSYNPWPLVFVGLGSLAFLANLMAQPADRSDVAGSSETSRFAIDTMDEPIFETSGEPKSEARWGKSSDEPLDKFSNSADQAKPSSLVDDLTKGLAPQVNRVAQTIQEKLDPKAVEAKVRQEADNFFSKLRSKPSSNSTREAVGGQNGSGLSSQGAGSNATLDFRPLPATGNPLTGDIETKVNDPVFGSAEAKTGRRRSGHFADQSPTLGNRNSPRPNGRTPNSLGGIIPSAAANNQATVSVLGDIQESRFAKERLGQQPIQQPAQQSRTPQSRVRSMQDITIPHVAQNTAGGLRSRNGTSAAGSVSQRKDDLSYPDGEPKFITRQRRNQIQSTLPQEVNQLRIDDSSVAPAQSIITAAENTIGNRRTARGNLNDPRSDSTTLSQNTSIFTPPPQYPEGTNTQPRVNEARTPAASGFGGQLRNYFKGGSAGSTQSTNSPGTEEATNSGQLPAGELDGQGQPPTNANGTQALPRWPTMALLMSLGANVYFCWIAWNAHSRYQDLVEDMAESDSRTERQKRRLRDEDRPSRRVRDSVEYAHSGTEI